MGCVVTPTDAAVVLGDRSVRAPCGETRAGDDRDRDEKDRGDREGHTLNDPTGRFREERDRDGEPDQERPELTAQYERDDALRLAPATRLRDRREQDLEH